MNGSRKLEVKQPTFLKQNREKIRPCHKKNQGIIDCQQDFLVYNISTNWMSENETLMKDEDAFDGDRNKIFEEKYAMNKGGKTMFKRDAEAKENDPWSLISPIGKLNLTYNIFCCLI